MSIKIIIPIFPRGSDHVWVKAKSVLAHFVPFPQKAWCSKSLPFLNLQTPSPLSVPLDHAKRLGALHPYSMEHYTMKGNYLETYNILKGPDRLDTGRMLLLAEETKPWIYQPPDVPFWIKIKEVVNLWNFHPHKAVEAINKYIRGRYIS